VSLRERFRAWLAIDADVASVAALRRALPEQIRGVVQEELARLRSSVNRFVACPDCGASYDLSKLGIKFNVRAATICCSQCHCHFEVHPGMFWEHIEVARR